MANDVFQVELLDRCRRRPVGGLYGNVAQALVRSLKVVVGQPRPDDVTQMRLAKDNEVVETLGFCAAYPTFAVGIQVGTACRNWPEFQTVQFQDRAELLGEFGITITDDMSGTKLGRFVSEGHAHVPGNLCHPSTVRSGRHAGNMDAARMQVNEEQHEIRNRTSKRPNLLRKKIGGPNRFDVTINEVAPGAAVPLRARIETMLYQDATNGRPGDVPEAELPEFAENASITPASGRRHRDNQLSNLLRFPRPATFVRLPARVALAQPAGEGSRMDDGDDILEWDITTPPFPSALKSRAM
jgi:hypothetical protein